MAHQVFVSHATEDRETASRVFALLEADGGDAAGTSVGGETARPSRSRRKIWMVALAAVLVVGAVAAGLTYRAATPSHDFWTRLSPGEAAPPGREEAAMAYDPDNRRMIMFGGKLSAAYANDTWVYDSTASIWSRQRPVGALPPARYGHSMVYDPSRHRMVVFGGACGDAGVLQEDVGGVLGDTWAFNPVTNSWAELEPTGQSPMARASHEMVYDPTSGRVIMFGGFDDFGARLDDTWAYDPVASTWTDLDPKGTVPPARSGQAMAYDPSSGRVIMFGGLSDRHTG